MDKRLTIAEAAAGLLATRGVPQLTVARIARAAHVSTALVHYHFATKRKLLATAARLLAARRTDLRIAALKSERGLDALDAAWNALAGGVAGDAERAWHDLVLLGREDPDVRAALSQERERERLSLAASLPTLLADLGSRPGIGADDLATLTTTCLDGIALALAGGAPPDEVRAAYDAFWLALLALGQTAPAR